MSCWRKSAFSAISWDLLFLRSVRVESGKEVPSGLVQRARARGEHIQAAIQEPLESGENTIHSRSFSIT
jgi:hypothetical protein